MCLKSKNIRREQRSESGRRATSSRVLADPNVGEGEGGGLTDTRSARKADGNGVTMFRKSPTVPAEHKGDSAIPESSATRDNYITDQPRLKTDR